MPGTTMRALLVSVLVVIALAAVFVPVAAQGTTPTATPVGESADAAGAAGGSPAATAAAMPSTLPSTGGGALTANALAVILLALGASLGLAGLLMRGLRWPL